MFNCFVEFCKDEEGQDFAEYAIILGAIGIVASAVIYRYRSELMAAWNSGISGLAAAH
jgi:Flp pilus assembly pilin Flp